jgi:hypothetical protein
MLFEIHDPPVTGQPARTLMNSCPSSVSSLSIVLEGGRSLREVGYVAESASRTFCRLLGARADLFYL